MAAYLGFAKRTIGAVTQNKKESNNAPTRAGDRGRKDTRGERPLREVVPVAAVKLGLTGLWKPVGTCGRARLHRGLGRAQENPDEPRRPQGGPGMAN